jgi:hypothetical protein
MTPKQAQLKLNTLLLSIKDAVVFLEVAKVQVEAVDPDNPDSGDPAVNLDDARSELTNASNAIDEAMGLVDELMRPEPGPYDDPHCP